MEQNKHIKAQGENKNGKMVITVKVGRWEHGDSLYYSTFVNI